MKKATSSDIRRRLDAVDQSAFDALAVDYATRHAGQVVGLDDLQAMVSEYGAAVAQHVPDLDRRRVMLADLRPLLDALADDPPVIEDLPGVPREHIDRLPSVLVSRKRAFAIFQTVRRVVFRQVQGPDDQRAIDAASDRIFRRYFDDQRRGKG